MAKVNVGLSRKITRDYNSTGYTVNIEGEVTAPLDQPQAVLQQFQNLFRIAENALAQEIQRDQGRDHASGRNEDARQPNGNGQGREQPVPPSERSPTQQDRSGNGQPDAASDKQIRYLNLLAKRHALSRTQLEDRITETLGHRVTVSQLTKREAGRVIESLA